MPKKSCDLGGYRIHNLSKDGELLFIIGNHLGSTSLVTDDAGNVISEMRYKACPTGVLREGEVRHASGSEVTKYQYTGQYSDSYINLLWYGSRHYDPELGRFTSPDTIIPDPAGSQRIAMRKNGTLNFIIGDHFGSTSLVTDANGNVISEMKYKAWGEERYSNGTKQTSYGYTGQYSYAAEFGLHYYNARWYDSLLSRFNQPDTIIPEESQGVQAWDRFAYVNNNPVRYITFGAS